MRALQPRHFAIGFGCTVLFTGISAHAGKPPDTLSATSSGQLVQTAAQAIDDKSPMATSISGSAPGFLPADRMRRINAHLLDLKTITPDEFESPGFLERIQLKQPKGSTAESIVTTINTLLKHYNTALREEGLPNGRYSPKQRQALKEDFEELVNLYAQLESLNPAPIGYAVTLTSGARSTNNTSLYQRLELSEVIPGADIDFQTYSSDPTSVSLGAKVDISPLRRVRMVAIETYVEYVRDHPKAPTERSKKLDYLAAKWQLLSEAQKAVVALSNGLRVSVSSNFTSVHGFGSVYSSGIGTSSLIKSPLGSGGITFQENVQQLRVNSELGGISNVFVPGASIFWQDKVNSVDSHGNLSINRWKYQVGLEYSSLASFHHVHDVYDGFIRYRLPKTKFSEVKFSAGPDSSNVVRFQLEFGYTFGN